MGTCCPILSCREWEALVPGHWDLIPAWKGWEGVLLGLQDPLWHAEQRESTARPQGPIQPTDKPLIWTVGTKG